MCSSPSFILLEPQMQEAPRTLNPVQYRSFFALQNRNTGSLLWSSAASTATASRISPANQSSARGKGPFNLYVKDFAELREAPLEFVGLFFMKVFFKPAVQRFVDVRSLWVDDRLVVAGIDG